MATTDPAEMLDVLTKLTRRSIRFAWVVFQLRVNDEPATTEKVAERVEGCSFHLAASALHDAADAGALTQGDGGWHVTDEGLSAMRVHFVGWSDHFDADAEMRGLR